MLKYLLILLQPFLLACPGKLPEKPVQTPKFVLLIHGGAGTITKDNMTPNKEAEYRGFLDHVLSHGKEQLLAGAHAIDVVEKLNQMMEDSPLFNAGRGSVFNAEGKQDMDASIMDGKTLNCGAVAGVSNIKNPISAARVVMDSSEHVFLSRAGAESFSRKMQLELRDSSYFFNENRYNQWKRNQNNLPNNTSSEKHGTVGVVCLDEYGNLAAGTSTGGMTNKKWGRIGDSPIIGAGTYADNRSCAVSSTGHGEYFIRATVARDIAALIEYKGYSPERAAHEVIQLKLTELGGEGGVIVVDRLGRYSMTFNTEGMYRGIVTSDIDPTVFIYK